MTIFLRELKRNRKTFIIWSIILLVFCIYTGALFPTISSPEMSKNINDLMKGMPEAMTKALNMDQLNFSSILGFFGVETYLFITLLGSVYAMILGSGILSKEESDKTIEFLLAKPVTRNNIVTSKALCTLFYITLLDLILILANFIIFEAVKREPYSMSAFLALFLGAYLLHTAFAAIGFFISVFIVKAKSIFPISIGAVLGMYFLKVLTGMSDKTEYLKYLSPFEYVNSSDLIKNGSIWWVYLLIFFAIFITTIPLAYVFYNKKDITV